MTTKQVKISYNEVPVPVYLIGTTQKLIPALLSALRLNKLTLASFKESPLYIDLYNSEAILYASEGNKYRIPIF
ncbi:hypothetical protein P5G65_09850 [Paenibacillus chondroitinus]|uniref:Uncharacterized protein n=1 Tax=Paenibacillus chondroitinus TaxID=59842 RepID=A0ABU6DA68_9BACL|nr:MULTISPECIES: hypothetical protein [Paenibacillus]MCY9656548.1 hypothetical protein [Paenibacillus anseongense]MEB4794197.1 hypothetical protein [Paenibacillus chondroitinus]